MLLCYRCGMCVIFVWFPERGLWLFSILILGGISLCVGFSRRFPPRPASPLNLKSTPLPSLT